MTLRRRIQISSCGSKVFACESKVPTRSLFSTLVCQKKQGADLRICLVVAIFGYILEIPSRSRKMKVVNRSVVFFGAVAVAILSIVAIGGAVKHTPIACSSLTQFPLGARQLGVYLPNGPSCASPTPYQQGEVDWTLWSVDGSPESTNYFGDKPTFAFHKWIENLPNCSSTPTSWTTPTPSCSE